MTDKELIRALRACPKCQLYEYGDCGVDMKEHAADRLEALLAENARLKVQNREECCQDLHEWHCPRVQQLKAENEHLREATKMVPKWVSVTERLPHFNQQYLVTACYENAAAGVGIWHSTVVVVAEYYDGCWTWDDSGTEYDLNGLVTHWMPLPEPPSAEEVE